MLLISQRVYVYATGKANNTILMVQPVRAVPYLTQLIMVTVKTVVIIFMLSTLHSYVSTHQEFPNSAKVHVSMDILRIMTSSPTIFLAANVLLDITYLTILVLPVQVFLQTLI